MTTALSTSEIFQIRLGDCVTGMSKMPPSSVDVVVTSPPYNLGIQYTVYDDAKKVDDYLTWCEDWAAGIGRVLKDDGSFFLNFGAAPSNPFLPFQVAAKIGTLFTLQNTIHWIKSISVDRDGETLSFGHFKPINSKRYLTDCHEYVFHFTKSGTVPVDRLAVGVPYVDKSNVRRWAHTEGQDKRCRGNVWFIPYETIKNRVEQRPHPATFPAKLAEQCIRLHGKHDMTVMDPFLGIGHAALGARNCGSLVAQFIGFDIDEEYLNVACEMLGCEHSPVVA